MAKEYNIDFVDLFKENGLYVSRNFKEGFCFEIENGRPIKGVSYENKDDINPIKQHWPIHKNIVEAKYKKVFTRQELFNQSK